MKMAERDLPMDEISGLKGRIAEAFVEAIFRRAGYSVSRVGRESQVHRMVKIGSDEFLPDFLLRKPISETGSGRPLHRLIPIEVKYRSNIEEFLRRHGNELLSRVGEQWPELCIVFVTDLPASGRSCFQVIDLFATRPGAALASVDLHQVRDLDIYTTTVQEYEGLVRQIFTLLRFGAEAESPSRRTAT
jgi:hypothetical protein